MRALELAKVDRDRAALVVGHERGFTFRVYNPEGLDVSMLREVVELVHYPGLDLLIEPAYVGAMTSLAGGITRREAGRKPSR